MTVRFTINPVMRHFTTVDVMRRICPVIFQYDSYLSIIAFLFDVTRKLGNLKANPEHGVYS